VAAGRPGMRRLLRKALAAACWAYLGALLALWALITALGDRWWPATLALFAPRWIWAAPLAVLPISFDGR